MTFDHWYGPNAEKEHVVVNIVRGGCMWNVHVDTITAKGVVVAIRCPENVHVLAVMPLYWCDVPRKDDLCPVVKFKDKEHHIDLLPVFASLEESTRVYRAVRAAARLVRAEKEQQSRVLLRQVLEVRNAGMTSFDVGEELVHWPSATCHVTLPAHTGYDIRNVRAVQFMTGLHPNDGVGSIIADACAEVFRKRIRDFVKVVDEAGRKKNGREKWNEMVRSEARRRPGSHSDVYDDMTIQHACEWLCWAQANAHWKPTPEEKIAWSVMERKHEAQRSSVPGAGHGDHGSGP